MTEMTLRNAPGIETAGGTVMLGLRIALVVAMIVGMTVAAPTTPFATAPVANAEDCPSSVGPGIPPPANITSGLFGFHAAWYGQSGYPTLCPGQRATAVVAYYNSGSFGWVAGRLGEMAFLGTSDPTPGRDNPSQLGGPAGGSPDTGWVSANRVAAQPATYVGPGQIAWFQFTIQAPAASGLYFLYLRPVIEGWTWMEDQGVYWMVTVRVPGEIAGIVDSVNLDGDSFTAGPSTPASGFHYDRNDTFQYLGAPITFDQFEQALSAGDQVGVRYETDPARTSNFNLTNDVGRDAPTIDATARPVTGSRWNVELNITERASNADGLAYSLQRSTVSPRPTSCNATTGPYTEIATVIIEHGSNTAGYVDANRPDGIYCYRIGTPNSVSATRFGYSTPLSLFTPLFPPPGP